MTQSLVGENPSADAALVHLFDAATQLTSESPADAVVPPEGREGVYLGSGDGSATGERVDDGARIAFDAKGYGLRSPERYRLSMTMAFRTDDARYDWLNRVLGVMEGDFDEKTGRAAWHVYVPGR